MKSRNDPDQYQFDAEGKLVTPEGTTEEQQVVVEAAVLYKEGQSANHPADVAEQYAEEESGEVSIASISPTSAVSGGEDFTLYVTGTGFTEQSIIHFAGHEEPTTLNEDGTLSTGVKPSLWQGYTVVDCKVLNGEHESNVLQFTFNDGTSSRSRSDDNEDIKPRKRRF